jgi:putative membrane protein
MYHKNMRSISKLTVVIIANVIGLYISAKIVSGFSLDLDNTRALLIISIILTLLNYLLKPILRLVLGPIIILTLGLGLIVVNMIILYILDFLSPELIIQTIPALLYSSLIVGTMNFIFHLATKKDK